jgi:GDP-L-fucose synthase
LTFPADARIFVAGHRGLVGSAIVRKLEKAGHRNLVTRQRSELDLLDQAAVHAFFKRESIDYVFMAAGRVGGIYANSTAQADFLYENLVIATNVIHASAQHGVTKLLFLGSSCIYPRLAPQPIPEDALLTGPLEPTNEGYALAKIAGLKLCEYFQLQYGKRFISAMPTSLYGPKDNFDRLGSHVIPGMLRRMHEAKVNGAPAVTVWGTGAPRREFLFVDDLADALYVLMERYDDPQTINVGSGDEYAIGDLARIVKAVVGYEGEIVFDATKPDGMPRKRIDSSRIQALGWRAGTKLEDGLRATYEDFLRREMAYAEPAHS